MPIRTEYVNLKELAYVAWQRLKVLGFRDVQGTIYRALMQAVHGLSLEDDWPRLLICEDWLRDVGFKWHQIERQCGKQWVLWLGSSLREPDGKRRMFSDSDDLGLELAQDNSGTWFCWLRSDTAGRYHRFLHVRHLKYQDELIHMVEALTGFEWRPENNIYGSMHTPEHADYLRAEHERLDKRLIRERTKWSEVEKDDSRGRALPEHMQAAIDGGKAK